MGAPEFTSIDGERHYAAVVRAADDLVVGLDFDGVLSPIVDDPDQAFIHPGAADVLVALARRVRALAIITGRPARQAVELGGLEQVADAVAEHGGELYLFGQYGNERWSSTQRRIVGPRPPAGLATFERELPRLLKRVDAAGAHVEEKGLAVAVHTRRLPDAEEAFARLLPELSELARRHDLAVEPGRNVIEVRSGGMHKGVAVATVAAEAGARGFLYAGDDLGDLEAFDAVEALRRDGLETLLVASASGEENALVERADVVVPGPDGVLDLLDRLATDARHARS